MAFVFDCAAWSGTCMTLAKLASTWMQAGGATVTASPFLPPANRQLTVEHKVLFLTTPGFTNTEFLEKTMQGYGVPYQIVPFDSAATPRLDLNKLLWNADGSARFSAYVMYPNLEALGHLNKTEVQTLWIYQRRTGARSVKFAAWPTNIGFNPNYDGCSSSTSTMAFNGNTPSGVSGVRVGAQLSTSGLYRCPGIASPALTTCSIFAADFADAGLTPGCTPTPILETDGGVVGATIK